MIYQEPWKMTYKGIDAATLYGLANLVEYPPGRPRKVFFVAGGVIDQSRPNNIIAPAFFHCHCPGPQRHEMVVLPPAMYQQTHEMIGYDNRLVASIHAWRGADQDLLQRWITHVERGALCPVRNQ